MSTKMITAWVNGTVQNIEVNETSYEAPAPTVEDRIIILENNATEMEDKVGVLESGATITEERIVVLENNTTTAGSITLLADAWVGETTPWAQVVEVDGVTVNSKIDLNPTPEVIYDLQEKKITLTAVNDNGVVTVYALATKPTSDYTIQVLRTEIVL